MNHKKINVELIVLAAGELNLFFFWFARYVVRVAWTPQT
jgi:hypothetical protein